MAPLPVMRQGGFFPEDSAFQPVLAVIRKGFAKAAHQAGIGVAQFRGFAQACAIRMAVQGKAAARLTQSKAFGREAVLQVWPAMRFAEIDSEKSPQGIDEPLIRPVWRLRGGLRALYLCRQSIADQRAKTAIAVLRQQGRGAQQRLWQFQGNRLHIHHPQNRR